MNSLQVNCKLKVRVSLPWFRPTRRFPAWPAAPCRGAADCGAVQRHPGRGARRQKPPPRSGPSPALTRPASPALSMSRDVGKLQQGPESLDGVCVAGPMAARGEGLRVGLAMPREPDNLMAVGGGLCSPASSLQRGSRARHPTAGANGTHGRCARCSLKGGIDRRG